MSTLRRHAITLIPGDGVVTGWGTINGRTVYRLRVNAGSAGAAAVFGVRAMVLSWRTRTVVLRARPIRSPIQAMRVGSVREASQSGTGRSIRSAGTPPWTLALISASAEPPFANIEKSFRSWAV